MIYASSLYIGFITPGRLGEFVKILYLKSDKAINYSKGFSSVLVDRLFDLYLLIILGFIGILQFDILGRFSDALLILSVLVIMIPIIMLNKQLVERTIKILYKIVVIKRVTSEVEGRFEDFYDGLNQLKNLRLLISGLLTCLSYFIFSIQCYLIVLAMGLTINFFTITFFMAISTLISFIPISISGLGTRDATLIFLFSLIGLKPEQAVSYAFLVFLTFSVYGGLMGAVAWRIKPLPIEKLKS